MHSIKSSTPAWIDITVPLQNDLVHYPGDNPFNIRRIRETNRGDVCTLSEINLTSHSGTHIDAPLHYLTQGQSIDQMPLDISVSAARVIAIQDPKLIRVTELETLDLRHPASVLFKTQNSAQDWTRRSFMKDYVALSPEAAVFLVRLGIRAVGIDYLSIGHPDYDEDEVHRILLRGGVWVIEALNLANIEPGEYEMVCLPLNIQGADGSPARVILRPALKN